MDWAGASATCRASTQARLEITTKRRVLRGIRPHLWGQRRQGRVRRDMRVLGREPTGNAVDGLRFRERIDPIFTSVFVSVKPKDTVRSQIIPDLPSMVKGVRGRPGRGARRRLAEHAA